MSKPKDFLSKEDEKTVDFALNEAEKNTSGEIRLHLESQTKEDHFKRAWQVFQKLKMHQTELRNGVLIYIALHDQKFVILGDEGINNVVADDFWDETKDIMQAYFRKGDFKTGIIEGVLHAGKELETHFPYQKNDENELPNKISRS
jgi:uncharacterized membrane protein